MKVNIIKTIVTLAISIPYLVGCESFKEGELVAAECIFNAYEELPDYSSPFTLEVEDYKDLEVQAHGDYFYINDFKIYDSLYLADVNGDGHRDFCTDFRYTTNGHNYHGYAFYNMKKGNITAYTPPIDEFFVVGKDILQIGIGDGGNEIGMGNLKSVIERDLNIIPSCINCHHLIVATVSNWGAYGLINELGREVNMSLLPPCTDIEIFTNDIVKKGAKDGISCLSAPTIDGFPLNIECDIVDQLRNL